MFPDYVNEKHAALAKKMSLIQTGYFTSSYHYAPEAYFKKVDQGVKEVVEKLEKVAEAMRGVEGESRSLWSNSDRSSASTDSPQIAVSTAPE